MDEVGGHRASGVGGWFKLTLPGETPLDVTGRLGGGSLSAQAGFAPHDRPHLASDTDSSDACFVLDIQSVKAGPARA